MNVKDSRGIRGIAIVHALLVMIGLGLCLTLAGCGQSGSFESTQPGPGGTAALEFNFDLEARQVPLSVSTFRVRGYAQDGHLAYGPVVRARTARLLLTDVPVLVKSIRLEYLTADPVVAGLYVASVDLRPGETLVIDDPPYEDLQGASSLTRIEVAPAAPNLVTGAQQDFSAMGIFNGAVRQDLTQDAHWTVGSQDVATVSNAPGRHGQVVAVAPGTTLVGATFAGKTGEANLTVLPGELLGVAVTPPTVNLPVGSAQQLVATGTYTGGYTSDITNQVTWATDNPAIADVQANGQVTGIAAGSATITATHVQAGLSANTTVTVEALRMTAISIEPANPRVPNGGEQQFTARGTFQNNTQRDVTADVEWSSSDEAIASVSNLAGFEGRANTHAVGQVTITAADPDNPSVNGSTALTVTDEELVSISISPTQPQVPVGLPQQFLATGHYTNGQPGELTGQVTWESTNPQVARVSNDAGSQGLVTTLSVGESTIKATDQQSGKFATTTINVVPAALVSIEVTPIDPHLSVDQDQPLQFAANGRFNNQTSRDITSEVTWASSNEDVASVSNEPATKGQATAKAVGQVVISAVHPDYPSVEEGSTNLSVDDYPLVGLQIDPVNFELIIGTSRPLTATGIYANGNRDLTQVVSWSSLNPQVATVGDTEGTKGLVTAVNEGDPCTIRATVPGTDFTADATVQVRARALTSLEVTPKNSRVANGRTVPFTAMGTYEGLAEPENVTDQVVWTSSDHDVAEITSAVVGRARVPNVLTVGGVATAKGLGHTQITATFPGSEVSDSTDLEVTDAELEQLTLEPLDSSRPKGLTVPFRAWGRFSDSPNPVDLTDSVQWESQPAGRVTFSVEPGQEGVATGREVGLATIKATYPQTGLSQSTTLNVTNPELLSMRVDPATLTLQPTDQRQFRAWGTFRDFPQEVEVTEQVTWNPSVPAVAQVSIAEGSRGLVTALAAGVTDIVASYPLSSVTGSATLTVQAPQVGSFKVRIQTSNCLLNPEGVTVKFSDYFAPYSLIHQAVTDENGEVTVTSNEVPPNRCIKIAISGGNQSVGRMGIDWGAWDGTTGGEWKSPYVAAEPGVVVFNPVDPDFAECTPPTPVTTKWGNAQGNCPP